MATQITQEIDKFIRFIESAQEVVAFQAESAPFTVYRGLDSMSKDPALMAECPTIFGMTFARLDQGLRAMPDKEYFPVNPFE